ncbi:MAG: hypothetical protein LBU03_03265, partial [Tannerellaceae bacterium]|nr:hypothetical protein [Tannerellaceae bacterium]
MKIMLSFACLTLVATLLASPTLAQEPSWKGSGLPDDPYLIESVEHLLELQDAVSNFPSDNSQFPYNPVFKPFNGTHFLLTTDLDLADYNAAHPEGWTPIGYHYRE